MKPGCCRHLAGRTIGGKHCRQDAGSTFVAPSHPSDVHGPNAKKTEMRFSMYRRIRSGDSRIPPFNFPFFA